VQGLLRYYIDGQLVDDPLNWADFDDSIERRADLRALVVRFADQMVFDGSGYGLIWDRWKSNACQELILTITNTEDGQPELPYYEGLIKVIGAKFNQFERIVTTEVTDTSYYGRIFSNKDIEVNIFSSQSKSGATQVPISAIDVDMFNPTTGLYTITRKMYDVVEVLEWLVAWMSDNELTFQSDFLNALPNDEKLAIIQGEGIRTSTIQNNIEISFQGLVDELSKQFRLTLFIDAGNVVRLENDDDLFDPTVITTIEEYTTSDGNTLTVEADANKLYGAVILGSEETKVFNGSTNSLPNVNRFWFRKSTFSIEGQCQTGAKLDLVKQYVVDHNTIEEILVSLDETHQDDLFFIQYTAGTPNVATQSHFYDPNPVGGAPYLYNESMLSVNSWVQTTVVSGDLLEVDRISDSPQITLSFFPLLGKLPMDNIVFDPAGGFNNSTFFYSFNTATTVDITVSVFLKNKVGFIAGQNVQMILAGSSTFLFLDLNANLTNTDETIVWTFPGVVVPAGEILTAVINGFGTEKINVGAGSFIKYENGDYLILDQAFLQSLRPNTYTFSTPMSEAQFEQIKSNPNGKVNLKSTYYPHVGGVSSPEVTTVGGWVKSIVRNRNTGVADVVLIDAI